MESKVEETFSDSRGSLRKTNVSPFCFEKTKIMKADSLISESVICRGIVRLEAAARG
jgi:ssRNA-specific RNase YbeY (16S rRNA maturation enzyme)